LIILDIVLPDIDGYTVCRRLRSLPRTSHVPIIFLTQRDDLSDKLQGLALGVDDYITKPFDLEELGWRVQNAITRSEREKYMAGLVGLPAGRMIEKHLDSIMSRDDWALMDILVEGLSEYETAEGVAAANRLIQKIGRAMIEVLGEYGQPIEYIGQASKDNFIITTARKRAKKLEVYFAQALTEFLDHPLITARIGFAYAETGPYDSISEIIQKANEDRQDLI
jgi:response regulator RpfG family c-di-GMP phosphodiesterase